MLEQLFESHWVYAYYISRGCGPGSYSVLLNNVIRDVHEIKPESRCASFLLHSDKHIITYLLFTHALHRLAGKETYFITLFYLRLHVPWKCSAASFV